MEYVQPTDQEIRDRIEKVKDKQLQMLFKYQYQILGRISEVAGKYMPRNDEHRVYDIDGEEVVMFIVKTAKRKGYLRPCAHPINKKYDPWTKELLDYITSSDTYPFLLHENVETSKTYAMEHAPKIFKDMYWPMSDYTRAIPRTYTSDMVKTKRWGKDGYEEYLVFFPDGERAWTKDKEIAHVNVKIEPRWKRVTSHVLRKISQNTLMYTYGLDEVDCAIIGGWTVTGQASGVSQSMSKHYMYMDLRESEWALPQLERLMNRYVRKLFIPYADLVS